MWTAEGLDTYPENPNISEGVFVALIRTKPTPPQRRPPPRRAPSRLRSSQLIPSSSASSILPFPQIESSRVRFGLFPHFTLRLHLSSHVADLLRLGRVVNLKVLELVVEVDPGVRYGIDVDLFEEIVKLSVRPSEVEIGVSLAPVVGFGTEEGEGFPLVRSESSVQIGSERRNRETPGGSKYPPRYLPTRRRNSSRRLGLKSLEFAGAFFSL